MLEQQILMFTFFMASVVMTLWGVYVLTEISNDYKLKTNQFRRKTVRPYCLRIAQGIIISGFIAAAMTVYMFAYDPEYALTGGDVAFIATVYVTFSQMLILANKIITYDREIRSTNNNPKPNRKRKTKNIDIKAENQEDDDNGNTTTLENIS